MGFPRTVHILTWTEYLGRLLDVDEKKILYDVKTEYHNNLKLTELCNNCRQVDMYIPKLTNLNSHNLFESLVYHNIGSSVETLRKGVACMMYIFRDCTSFLDNGTTLYDLFSTINNTQYVRRTDDKTVFRYTYSVMCKDLMNNDSWERVPVELVLCVVSKLYKVDIVVFTESDKHCYKTYTPVRTVYIGRFNNNYVPVDNIKTEQLMYRESMIKFLKWAVFMGKCRDKK